MKSKYVDAVGQEIQVGDWVAYSYRVSSSLYIFPRKIEKIWVEPNRNAHKAPDTVFMHLEPSPKDKIFQSGKLRRGRVSANNCVKIPKEFGESLNEADSS